MPIPDNQSLMFPVLRLAGDRKEHPLAELRQRIAAHLSGLSQTPNTKPSQTYEVSVRVANEQSKYYYVIGTVTTQGRFKVTGGETVLDAILLAGLRSNSASYTPTGIAAVTAST